MTTWAQKIQAQEGINDNKRHFKNKRLVTTVIKLQNFQYRLLHNRIFCNNMLVHLKKVPSNICDFCVQNKQSIQHLLYLCQVIRPIWHKLQAKLRGAGIKCLFSIENIVFNKVKENTAGVCNIITLICKQYIYRCKCQGIKPNYRGLIDEIKLQYKMELYNANKVNTIERICKKWSPVLNICIDNM